MEFYLLAAAAVLIVAAVAVVRNRNNTSKWITYVTLAIFFSTFLMVLPTAWGKEGVKLACEPLHKIVSALLYSFKALGGRQDISQVESIGLEGFAKTVYVIINYIAFAAAPILASSMILSFIGDMGDRMRYATRFSPVCYVFSEINDNSLSLAKGIKDKKGRKTIVFCNTKDTDKAEITKARELGAILLYKSCKDIKFGRRFKSYELCLISESEDDNIKLAEAIILKKNKLKKYDIVVNAFAHSGISINLLENLMKKSPCFVFDSLTKETLEKAEDLKKEDTKIVFCNTALTHISLIDDAEKRGFTVLKKPWEKAKIGIEYTDYNITLFESSEEGFKKKGLKYKGGRFTENWVNDPLRIRFVDEIALFCYNLLYEHPLYNLPENRHDISVMLVGCGCLGMRMLKTVVWAGQIDGFTLKIKVYDKQAKEIENKLLLQCPELKGYGIDFIDVDIESAELKEKMKDSLDAAYVCIATGSDDLNLSTAENLYHIFRRNNIDYTPPIFTRVRKTIKSENYNEKGSYLKNRNIHLFGTVDSVFKEKTLFNSKLENLAFAVNLCYCWALGADKESFEYGAAAEALYGSEYNRRSSMAAALHIAAKLYSCGLANKENSEIGEENLLKFEKLISEKKTKLDDLAKNEHDRWNAFVRSEGYVGVDMETVKGYADKTHSHKDDESKRHPCILSWEELDKFQKEYDACYEEFGLKKCDFKEYDYKIVKEIPQIVRAAE